jgi:hypothetical protein
MPGPAGDGDDAVPEVEAGIEQAGADVLWELRVYPEVFADLFQGR